MAIKNSDRAYAESAIEARRILVAAAANRHEDGDHVGTSFEDTGCYVCQHRGDMPRLGFNLPDREALLERNIKEHVDLMRLRAAMSKLEHIAY
ncbi:hypothetical protein D6T64_05670 [Cryobacterium melibiosiphilum]|uniref:Uncharacterized protein n=1 Tax=Cryobacterium melibiosiphilum TaxID=995039 RepID=A0A3A5MRX9_9MICO|nr:hypothetical protein [Cryobacterium melibiosiphilum]RJT89823.1 hypothetical protein D6T64_05670 [Cryobacterium melibiosiphilum]